MNGERHMALMLVNGLMSGTLSRATQFKIRMFGCTYCGPPLPPVVGGCGWELEFLRRFQPHRVLR